ncbi:MAG: hypothetical protein ABSD73_05295 [Candidatus Bathyarchaeia archaeon]|jgi:hypothetical protein
MSQDSENVKRLIDFKKRIETRLQELEAELKEFKTMLDTVNSILLEKGFRRVEIEPKPDAARTLTEEKEETVGAEHGAFEAEVEPENVNTLKSVNGEVLADFYVDDNSLHVVPAEDKDFSVNTPPFNQFFVQRVLLKMQERDSELARSGQLAADKILCFDIAREGDVIREIVIRNFDSDRLKELKSSIRWTFEKMLEKMKG